MSDVYVFIPQRVDVFRKTKMNGAGTYIVSRDGLMYRNWDVSAFESLHDADLKASLLKKGILAGGSGVDNDILPVKI